LNYCILFGKTLRYVLIAIQGKLGMVGHDRDRREPGCRASEALLRSYCEGGDLAARERLIELHLPLVRALAQRFAHRGERLEDLVQVGAIGLIVAIDRFDPAKGRALASFAVPTITGEIRNHLRDRSGLVRIPRRFGQLNGRLQAERHDLAARLRRAPTLLELARQAGIGEDEAREAIATELVRSPVPLPPAGESAESDPAIVDDAFESAEDRLLLAAGFRALDPRQRRILHLRFFAGMSQAEIAREVGLSQIQVSRVIRASLERLRGALEPRRAREPATTPR
jgi:RNA polymerase sigma-B factor